ncbi:MAG TPA: DUF2189 domain-containing protein [Rhodocyclaceae bacterium]|nr:DUF2189 domain-containing protein [Rhodocyclaceae bacterium]
MAHQLNHHLNSTPHRNVMPVEIGRPWVWIKRGWSDMIDNLGVSLLFGLVFAAAGYAILTYAASQPYLFTAAVSGFMLVGPLAAAGLYEISRRHEQGQHTNLMQSLHGLARNGESLFYYGVILAVVMLAWERISAFLFGLFYHDTAPDMANFFHDVFLSGNYVHFVVAYMVIGGAICVALYALSAISIPMIMDRDVDVKTAMVTSIQTVGHNITAMAVWAVILVVLIALGFATWMVGMVITLPLAGHATWHAYRDLVSQNA